VTSNPVTKNNFGVMIAQRRGMVVCSCIQASEGVSVAKYVEFWLHFIGVRSIQYHGNDR
jgi:hypothetical protein